MLQNKGVIDYHVSPQSEVKLDIRIIQDSLDFLKDLESYRINNWIIFSDPSENIKISISKTGIIEISVDVELAKLKETIYLIDKLTNKILSTLKIDIKFLVDVYISGSNSIGLEYLLKKELNLNDFKELNLIFDSDTKVYLKKYKGDATILIRGQNNIDKIFQVYRFINTGKIEDLRNFSIKGINVTTPKTITKDIFLNC